MVACPTCGEGSSVQIVRDAAQPWETGATDRRARWVMHCDSCGADWGMVDGAVRA
jgi:uncharacterized Zn finger protein